jgi:hypothetical protein
MCQADGNAIVWRSTRQVRKERHGNADCCNGDVRSRLVAGLAVAVPAAAAPDLRVCPQLDAALMLSAKKKPWRRTARAFPAAGLGEKEAAGVSSRDNSLVSQRTAPVHGDSRSKTAADPELCGKAVDKRANQARSATMPALTSRPSVASTVATMPCACSPAFSYIFSGLS